MDLNELFKKYESQIELQPPEVKKLLEQLKKTMEELDKAIRGANGNEKTDSKAN